ncbi:hypothetical protein HDU80_000387 [Chytriomyces hyalinus]|nr:hypothetical protein HDU80_000387 [Chytriomyces hyalinus]
MSSKRLACSAQRLVLTATPGKVTFRIDMPSVVAAAALLDSLKLSLDCATSSKSSFLEDLNKPATKEPVFDQLLCDKDTATLKEGAKTIVPEAGPLQCVSPIFTTPSLGLSFKNTNNHEAQPASTPAAAAADSNEPKASVVEADEEEDDRFGDYNYEKDKEDRRYKPEYLEQDLNRLSDLNPHESYSSAHVIRQFSGVMLRMYPYINHAIIEWYDIVGLPKVKMDPSERHFGVLEYRVSGNLAKSLARHVGTRYMKWFNDQL